MRWILVGTAAVWIASEPRQSVTLRPEGVRGELLFRLIVAGGALGAVEFAKVATSATIRPVAVADAIGLVLFWAGIALRLWSFRTLGGGYRDYAARHKRLVPFIW